MAGAEIPVEDLLDRPWTGYSEETLDLLDVFFPPIADQLIRRLLEASPARLQYDPKKTVTEAMKTGIAYPQYTRAPRKTTRAKLVVVIRFSGVSGLSMGPILRVVEILRGLADFEVYALSTVLTPAVLRPDVFSIEDAWRHSNMPFTPKLDGYRMVAELHSDADARNKHLLVFDALETAQDAPGACNSDDRKDASPRMLWNREMAKLPKARRKVAGSWDRYRSLQKSGDPDVARYVQGLSYNWSGRYGGVANPLAEYLYFSRWLGSPEDPPEGPPNSRAQYYTFEQFNELSLVPTCASVRELYEAAGLPPSNANPNLGNVSSGPTRNSQAIFAGLVRRLAAKYASVHWMTTITDHMRRRLQEGDGQKLTPYVDSAWWKKTRVRRGEFKFPGWDTQGVLRWRASTLNQLIWTFEQIMRGL